MSRTRVFLLSLVLAASALVPAPGFAEPRTACAAPSSASPFWAVFQVGFPRLAALWEKFGARVDPNEFALGLPCPANPEIGPSMDPNGLQQAGPTSIRLKIGSIMDPNGQPIPAVGVGGSEGSNGLAEGDYDNAAVGSGRP